MTAAEINPMDFAENPWHQSLAGPPAGAGGAPSTDFLCSATSPPAAEYDCVRRRGGSPGWAPAFDLHGQDGNIHSGLLSNSQLVVGIEQAGRSMIGTLWAYCSHSMTRIPWARWAPLMIGILWPCWANSMMGILWTRWANMIGIL